jgi:NAD(P)-dependent dehydrogenase (short-subunit alcohol dehydrogenase family)
MEELSGKVAVVTGAASGIGHALADRFAAEGMRVVLADVEREPLAVAATALSDAGADVLAVPTDVSNGDSVDALAAATLERFGAVHVVCNNAGVGAGGLMWELTTADWEWVLGVNLWGVIHGIRAFVPHLVAQGEGHVVNTASMAGLTSPPVMGPYNASKHAVVTISETLYADLASQGLDGIGVSVVCPGWVNTRIGESRRNRPADLATEGTDDPVEDLEAMSSVLGPVLASGLAPAQVADQVLDAIAARRFYVLTHPDWKPTIEHRVANILEDRPPDLSFLPT